MHQLKPRFEHLGVATVRGYPDDPDDCTGVTVISEFASGGMNGRRAYG